MQKTMVRPPKQLTALEAATRDSAFGMPSEFLTGSLLRCLAASKPGGNLLELGTGTGLATAWILDGMDQSSRLLTLDNDETWLKIARAELGQDPRLEIACLDGDEFLAQLAPEIEYDLIFADTWPGKYRFLDEALAHVAVGGIYIVDDMLPQPNWPEGHDRKANALVEILYTRPDFAVTELDWATGIILATRLEA